MDMALRMKTLSSKSSSTIRRLQGFVRVASVLFGAVEILFISAGNPGAASLIAVLGMLLIAPTQVGGQQA